MLWHILLIAHICAAVVGLMSGFLAMFLRKGSGLHGAAGTVFFVSMVTMTTTAAYIATFLRPIAINVVAALLTFYLVMTARRAATHRDGRAGMFDVGALLFILAVGIGGIATGMVAATSPTGAKHGIPAAVYFIFGTVALLCAVSDVRMLRRGGAVGQQRIARHLWRMSLALLIATLSFYPGQAKLFPKWLRETNLLFVPHVLLIGSMLFYKIRVGRRKRLQQAQPVVVNTSSAAIAA
jgi:uncharacterized membrane protein